MKPPHSTVTVAYTEPTAGTDGKPLTNLAYTTIYYNAGDGPVIGKVVPRLERPAERLCPKSSGFRCVTNRNRKSPSV
ncbi:MAG: hypothetical protein IPJ44_02210 [Nitrospira sp.]|nr:hypothetical protein [Nitrospira sp.]